MSIIYGYINLDKQSAEPAVVKKMESALTGYKSDAHTAMIQNNVSMGFFNQWVTYESQFDTNPVYDKQNGLYFVCDAIIDNRDELISIIGLKQTKKMPDSQIVFEAYKKWKKDCTRYLIGDFTFVVYEEMTNQVFMFRDHMGKRLLYYKIEDNRVFFSTLIRPLIDPLEKKRKVALNERYLTEFLSINEIRHEISLGYTIYDNINYVYPAGILNVSDNKVFNEIYWDPTKIKVDKAKYNSDYVGEFKRIFSEAVNRKLRVNGDIGILLSGGLDSGSVACVAASILGREGKKLNTYTSVPTGDYKIKHLRTTVVDESMYVRKMQEFYPNMSLHFVKSKELNSINVIERILSHYEQPYKFVENSYWLDDILQIASSDGCKVILSGHVGNSTISYGSYKTHLYEHARRLRLVNFVKDFQAFCVCNKLSRKDVAVYLAKEFFNSVFCFNRGEFSSEIVNKSYRMKFDTEKKLRAFGFSNKPILRIKDERNLYFHPTVTNHISSGITKLSLPYNIYERDPTGDKRLVEFCLSLPYECYFDRTRGLDRGLIRQAMHGIVPPEVLCNNRYGLQAADWLGRIQGQWDDFLSGFRQEIQIQNAVLDIVDLDYLTDLLNSNLEFDNSDAMIFRNIIAINICIKFYNML